MTASYYAGIGSRQTPPEIESSIMHVAMVCNRRGLCLRSGGAPGADTMFERYSYRAEIFLPWPGFNQHASKLHTPSPEAREIAARLHPAWRKCSDAAKKLHARNVHQILGRDLTEPVEFVVCWTPGGEIVGGTAMAIRVAQQHDIWVDNLWSLASRQVWATLAARRDF